MSINLSCNRPALLGSTIQTLFGWRGNFIFLAFLSIFYLFAAWRFLDGKEEKKAFSWQQIRADVGQTIKSPPYFIFTALSTLLWMGFISFVSGAPFILLSFFKQTPLQFGMLYALVMMGFVSGTLVARFYPIKYSTSTWILALASLLFLLQLFMANLPMLLATSFLYLFSVGLLLPIAQAQAVSLLEGQASYGFGIMYFFMMLLGGGCGLLIHSTTAVLNTLMLMMCCLGLAHGLFLALKKHIDGIVI